MGFSITSYAVIWSFSFKSVLRTLFDAAIAPANLVKSRDPSAFGDIRSVTGVAFCLWQNDTIGRRFRRDFMRRNLVVD
jgi:hypothetical protein